MPIVESRYAEALLSIASSAEAADRIETVLLGFSTVFSSNDELRSFLSNPVIPDEIKKAAIKEVLSEDATPILVNFMSLLIDRGRLLLLPAIYKEYKQLKNIWQKKLDIQVYSSEALSENQLLQIREKYQNQYGASDADIHNYVDASLLGGISIKIGDTYVDDSLSGRLKELLLLIKT